MKIKKTVNKAGIALVNGLNASNPDHVQFTTFEQTEPIKRQSSEEENLGKLTMATGAVITLGAVTLEAVGVGPEDLINLGALMGLGGIAVGAAVYGMGHVSNR